jgi:uncharacterized protein HemY
MSEMSSIAKLVVFIGLVITAVGIVLLFADKIPWLGKLPGDIHIQRKNFSFYFPVTTCIVISILLSVVFYFITKR